MSFTDTPYEPTHFNSDSDASPSCSQCKHCNCFSDSDERSHSLYESTCGRSCQEEWRSSCLSAADVSVYGVTSSYDSDVDLESGLSEVKLSFSGDRKDCRICHLSLETDEDEEESAGGGIDLGCSCKDDLAAAHLKCAETWFKMKGNTTCEICGCIARNIGVEVEANHATSTPSATLTGRASPRNSVSDVRQGCCRSHQILNFLIICMVFAFVISWVFHFR